MILLLIKVTLVFALALAALPLMAQASASLRHRICAIALVAGALMPLTLLWRPVLPVLQIPARFVASAAPVRTPAPFHWERTLGAIWVAGALLMIVRLLFGFRQVAAVRSRATALGNLSQTTVYEADVAVPVAVGLVCPAILLPRSASEWPEEQRMAALRHEAAHIARYDLWTNLLAHLTCAAYWFHPLAWVLARSLREEQEAACDDAALLAGSTPVSYAEALLAAAKHARRTDLIGCHMTTRTTLRNRIARLVNDSLPRTASPSARRRTALASAAAVLCVGLLNAGPQTPETVVGSKIYKMGNGVSAPRLLGKVEPEYTQEAKDAHIEGKVLLSVVIYPDGKAHDINVVEGLPSGLSEKAVEAVQQWRFQPGTLEGQDVAVRASIEINFKMK